MRHFVSPDACLVTDDKGKTIWSPKHSLVISISQACLKVLFSAREGAPVLTRLTLFLTDWVRYHTTMAGPSMLLIPCGRFFASLWPSLWSNQLPALLCIVRVRCHCPTRWHRQWPFSLPDQQTEGHTKDWCWLSSNAMAVLIRSAKSVVPNGMNVRMDKSAFVRTHWPKKTAQ